jgi:hypothetical protein
MTERLTCSNCGGPVTRNGNETRVTCTHCQNVTEFPPLDTAGDADDDEESPRQGRGGGGRDVPAIVIIQSGPTVVAGGSSPVSTGPIIVRRTSLAPYFLLPIVLILLSVGVTTWLRLRAAHLAEAIPAAEKAAERDIQKAEKAADKKSPAHR